MKPPAYRVSDPFPAGLQRLREACGLTRTEFAQKMASAGFPVSESEVVMWERGEAQLSIVALKPLLDVLGACVEARLAEQVWGSEAAREDELAEDHPEDGSAVGKRERG